MSSPIEFWFDFSSPYGYIAGERIEALAARHSRTVDWHPVLLGVVFKHSGGAPLTTLPMKADYALHDFPRSAAFHGVDYRHPSPFPVSSMAAARAFHAAMAVDATVGGTLARALMRAYFVDGIDISDPETTLAVTQRAGLGLDIAALREAMGSALIKERTRAETETAIARGVFGSPFIIVDGEAFWGVDRIEQVERWLATGGW
jgi:2-hydroxychromene-2-carboxylate isomerase